MGMDMRLPMQQRPEGSVEALLLKKATNLPIGRQAASNSKIGIICCYSISYRLVATTRRVAGPRPMAHDNVAQQESRADDTFEGISSKPPRSKQVYNYRLRYATRNGGGGMGCFKTRLKTRGCQTKSDREESEKSAMRAKLGGWIGLVDEEGLLGWPGYEIEGKKARLCQCAPRVGKRREKIVKQDRLVGRQDSTQTPCTKGCGKRLGKARFPVARQTTCKQTNVPSSRTQEKVDGEVQFSPARVSSSWRGI
ncbi:hypothetical protein V8C43DRAFT_271433 [Trichoderma afarasin]